MAARAFCVERPQGGSWPENTPWRVQRFNQLVRAAVARHRNAALFDLNALVSPGGHYASVISGQAVRSDDGVHFSAAGGAFVAAHLLPGGAALAKTKRADLRCKANRALGDIAYDQQQWADAVKSYQTALDNPPMQPVAATYLNYRIGAALQCQGEWTRAVTWFAKVVAAANDPALTDRAVRRMHATSFSLQYGAFSDPAGARALQARLQAAGIPATITSEIRVGNKLWYLAQSGLYANWTEATAARERVLAKFPAAVIVP